MKKIAIYGAGGFGKEVACMLNLINEKQATWELLGFFDDGKEKDLQISRFGKVLGNLNDLNNPSVLFLLLVIPEFYKSWSTELVTRKLIFPTSFTRKLFLRIGNHFR